MMMLYYAPPRAVLQIILLPRHAYLDAGQPPPPPEPPEFLLTRGGVEARTAGLISELCVCVCACVSVCSRWCVPVFRRIAAARQGSWAVSANEHRISQHFPRQKWGDRITVALPWPGTWHEPTLPQPPPRRRLQPRVKHELGWSRPPRCDL